MSGVLITPFQAIARLTRYRRFAPVSVFPPREGMRALSCDPSGRGGGGGGGPAPAAADSLTQRNPAGGPPAACGPAAGTRSRRTPADRTAEEGRAREQRAAGPPEAGRSPPPAGGPPAGWSGPIAEGSRRARWGLAPPGSCGGAVRAKALARLAPGPSSPKTARPTGVPKSEPPSPPPPDGRPPGPAAGRGPPLRGSPYAYCGGAAPFAAEDAWSTPCGLFAARGAEGARGYGGGRLAALIRLACDA